MVSSNHILYSPTDPGSGTESSREAQIASDPVRSEGVGPSDDCGLAVRDNNDATVGKLQRSSCNG